MDVFGMISVVPQQSQPGTSRLEGKGLPTARVRAELAVKTENTREDVWIDTDVDAGDSEVDAEVCHLTEW